MGSGDGVIDAQSRLEKVSSSVSSTGLVCSEEGSVFDSSVGDGFVLGPITLMVPATAGDGSDPVAFGSASPVGSPRFCDATHMGFGLAKSQIWLLLTRCWWLRSLR